MSRSEIIVESVLVGCDGIVLAKSRLGTRKNVIVSTEVAVAVSIEVKTEWTLTETTESVQIKRNVIAKTPLLPVSEIVGLSKSLQLIVKLWIQNTCTLEGRTVSSVNGMLGVSIGSFPTWYIDLVLFGLFNRNCLSSYAN